MVTNCELVEMLGLTYLMRTIYLCHYIKIIAIYSSHSLCFVGINRLESTPYHQTLARREHLKPVVANIFTAFAITPVLSSHTVHNALD